MTGGAGGPAGSPDFSDMFDGEFGRPGDGPQPGRNITVGLELAVAEVARGVTKTIVVPMLVECAACAASGAARGSRQVRCPACGGDGHSRRAGGGVTQQMCLPCRGTGEVPSDPCGECQGHGRSAGERTVRVAFPAGVSYGARLRVPGQGGAALPGGQPGDLYIQVGVPPGERPAMPGTVLIRNPPSRTIARVVLAGAWLLFGLHLTLSGPACLAYAGPAASCQASVSPLDGILLLVTIPLLIAAGASAYAHIVVGNDGVRPVGIRALIFRRHDVYAWPDITKVTPVTTSHRWTFFTVYVSRHLELSVKGKLNPVRLPAPRAGLLVSGRQYRERATKLQRIWLAQTGQTDGS